MRLKIKIYEKLRAKQLILLALFLSIFSFSVFSIQPNNEKQEDLTELVFSADFTDDVKSVDLFQYDTFIEDLKLSTPAIDYTFSLFTFQNQLKVKLEHVIFKVFSFPAPNLKFISKNLLTSSEEESGILLIG